jgi:hypothetical protein
MYTTLNVKAGRESEIWASNYNDTGRYHSHTLNTELGTWKFTKDEQISRFHTFKDINAIHIHTLINISYNKFRKSTLF